MKYSATSSLGWLDLDANASERVAAFIKALEEPGTLDVLGLGTIRDALSDLLAPGTSTIQTRLRYFMFIPWICQRLEHELGGNRDFRSQLRRLEVKLIDCLEGVGPDQGVIGLLSRGSLKRMPSEAYWGGLGSWRIRRRDLSISEYSQQAVRLARLPATRDDDGNITGRAVAMWAELPDAPAGFLHDAIDFELTAREAEFLIDQIRRTHPDSVLSVFGGEDHDLSAVGFPWEMPSTSISPVLTERLRHAQCFSELTAGPQFVYNIMLAQSARDELDWDTSELEDQQRIAVEDWASVIADRHGELSAWRSEIDEFWELMGVETARERTKAFVVEMIDRALVNAAGFADDDFVRRRVREREIALKSKRARLGHRSALQNWNGGALGGQFNFRWRTVSRYLQDLATTSARSQ